MEVFPFPTAVRWGTRGSHFSHMAHILTWPEYPIWEAASCHNITRSMMDQIHTKSSGITGDSRSSQLRSSRGWTQPALSCAAGQGYGLNEAASKCIVLMTTRVQQLSHSKDFYFPTASYSLRPREMGTSLTQFYIAWGVITPFIIGASQLDHSYRSPLPSSLGPREQSISGIYHHGLETLPKTISKGP